MGGKIHHIIIIKRQKLGVWIKGCRTCGNPMAILLGKSSPKCLECLMKEINIHSHIPEVLRLYTNRRLIEGIKSGRIQEFRVIKKPIQITWERIEKYKGDKEDGQNGDEAYP